MGSIAAEATKAPTPGRWTVIKGAAEGDDMRCAVVVEQGKMQYLIATIENGAPGDFCETEEANARLIAASPDLLFALEQLVSMAVVWETVDHRKNIQLENSEAYLRARAAISKATTP